MTQLDKLKMNLTEGKVYRRADLSNWSKSVDRHLEELVTDGTLQKLSPGMYYFPKNSVFGKTPPDEKELVQSFLKDDRFLLTSLNAYNSLGVGTTQLYNERVVYNHKRHGEHTLGNRVFNFKRKPHFPKKATEEFLLVDLVNNVEALAEDRNEVMQRVLSKAMSMNKRKLKYAVDKYGGVRAKKMFSSVI
jgi:hypothetical protein